MKVIEGIRGTNEGLEKALDQVFQSKIKLNGVEHPVIPQGNLDQILQNYYNEMGVVKD